MTNVKEPAQQGQWISVEDRLPEDTGKAYRIAVICTKQYTHDTNYPGEGLWRIQQDWNVRLWPTHYTHWMLLPLPAPPGSTSPPEVIEVAKVKAMLEEMDNAEECVDIGGSGSFCGTTSKARQKIAARYGITLP